MASAFQARASVNRWLSERLPLDFSTEGDRVAFQAAQEAEPTEWRVFWDGELEGEPDQAFSRMVQIDRVRADGDENALEQDLAAAMDACGLTWPGRGAAVPLYDYPADPEIRIGTATLRRLNGDGWRIIPDPADRPSHVRATITLVVTYPA